jgi:hypothetical protein
LQQITEESKESQAIKQNGQLIFFNKNFQSRFDVCKETLYKKSGKNLFGFSFKNKEYLILVDSAIPNN